MCAAGLRGGGRGAPGRGSAGAGTACRGLPCRQGAFSCRPPVASVCLLGSHVHAPWPRGTAGKAPSRTRLQQRAAAPDAASAAVCTCRVLRRPAAIASAPFYQRGSMLHLQVVSPLGHIGQLEAVDIGHDGANSADAWFCQEMLIRPSTQVAILPPLPAHAHAGPCLPRPACGEAPERCDAGPWLDLVSVPSVDQGFYSNRSPCPSSP